MLFATVLLASQAVADRRAVPKDARGSMPAPCNSNTLLNEFGDCHTGCGVHSQGDAVGSSCATNFCGSDGICCRQGVNAGVCDGTVGCNGWHCCVCTTSSTHSPTGAPAVAIKGDPFTTYQGKKTQFYMQPAVMMKMIQCGSIEVHGRAVNSIVKGDDQQWFDMFKILADGSEVVTVEARRSAQLAGAVSSAATDANDVKINDDEQNVAAALQRLRLVAAMSQTGVRSLTTLNVHTHDATVNTTGFHHVGKVNVTVAQDVSKSIGSGFVETVNVDSNDIQLQMASSVAGKFTSDEDRVRNLHVDVAFTEINAAQCAGLLPEIWGVKTMTKETAKLLIPPKTK